MLLKSSLPRGESREFCLPDPVHGMLQLTRLEELLVSTKTFHRLRYIRAMGLASRVALPSAVHTLFQHSLGTAHIARQLVRKVYDPDIEERRLDLLSVCALLHDVAAYPFSHSLRFIRRIEKQDRDEIVGKVIEYLFEDEIRNWEGPKEYESELQWLWQNRDEIRRNATTNFYAKDPPYYYWLFRSAISAHVLDFLARDAYYTGIMKRPLNLEWFIGNLRWMDDNPNLDSSAIMLFLETLAWLRAQTRELVIAKRYAADKLLCRLVDRALTEGIIEEEELTDPSRLIKLNDEALLHRIRTALQQKSYLPMAWKLIKKSFDSLQTGGQFGYGQVCSVEESKRLEEIVGLMRDEQQRSKAYLELCAFCDEIEQSIRESLGEEREYVGTGFPDMRYELYKRPKVSEESPDKQYIEKVQDRQVRERLEKAIGWTWTEGVTKEDMPEEIRVYYTGKLAPDEQEKLKQLARQIRTNRCGNSA